MSLSIKLVIVDSETHEPLIDTLFNDADDLAEFAQKFAVNQAGRANDNNVTVIANNGLHKFAGDELTSSNQQAIVFLKESDKDAFDE